jgi:hypothetical protein
MKFNIIDRDELYEASEVNKNLQIVEHKITEHLRYYTIDNFLKTPHKLITLLQKFPALSGLTYGARQQFTPVELRNLILAYCDIGKKIGLQLNPKSWITSSNIMWKDMPTKDHDWRPHSDFDVVGMIWLTDTKGGTGFYNFHGCPASKMLDDHGKKLHQNEKIPKEIKPWKTFEGNNEWQLYHIAETKFNSVLLYNGDFFHSPYPVFGKSYRYNLVSFYQNFEENPNLKI